MLRAPEFRDIDYERVPLCARNDNTSIRAKNGRLYTDALVPSAFQSCFNMYRSLFSSDFGCSDLHAPDGDMNRVGGNQMDIAI